MLVAWCFNFDLDASDLSAAVDVYSDWIDACDAVAKDAVGHEDGGQDYSGGSGVGSSRFARADDELEMNEDDEDDAEPDYGEWLYIQFSDAYRLMAMGLWD